MTAYREGEEKEPNVMVDKYICVDIDDTAFPHYYGFINDIGWWYIMKVDSTGAVRFARKQITPVGLYYDAWTNRTLQNYFFWDTQI